MTTKRVKIVTGLKCNIQCVFCYYRDNLKAPNRTFDDIRLDLLYAQKHGIQEIDFSGGEPTLHPDLSKLISEAKSLGMRKVSIITNGWRLADRQYLQTLKVAGLDEVLFSVHGPDSDTHDSITRVSGSFQRISEALTNAAEEGIMIRTNTVVNGLNYKHLPNIASFVLLFHPVQVNFITINDWCFAKNLVDTLMVPYSEMSLQLKKACDLLVNRVNTVNVRYIPFCFMKDYERFVCNHKQSVFDPYEWVPRVRARLEVQNSFLRFLAIVLYGFIFGGTFKKALRISPSELADQSIIEALRKWNYTKQQGCTDCRYEKLCDGVENTYANKYGLRELLPEAGEKIVDPNFFRNEYLAKI